MILRIPKMKNKIMIHASLLTKSQARKSQLSQLVRYLLKRRSLRSSPLLSPIDHLVLLKSETIYSWVTELLPK